MSLNAAMCISRTRRKFHRAKRLIWKRKDAWRKEEGGEVEVEVGAEIEIEIEVETATDIEIEIETEIDTEIVV